MPIEIVLKGRVPVKIWTDRIEPEAIEQLKNIASLPVVHPHVAAMPDVHLGKGATIGAVVPTRGAVCPAAVGVDIGCGMSARKTSIPAEAFNAEDLKKLRHSIEREIPVGRELKRQPFDAAVEWMDSHDAPGVVSKVVVDRALHQLGTLGGGNHFIEICVDREDGMLWALLHSGSRNVGKTVADVHIARAKKSMGRALDSLPDPDLAWLAEGTPEFEQYNADREWCQAYARENRAIMMERLLRQLAFALGYREDVARLGITVAVDCHHNYVTPEVHFGEPVLVTRKGAIRAGVGELGIIPGSMGTGTYIVRGLGNREAFESAPHGAGRKMSRSEARRRFTAEDLVCQTEGVECRKDVRVVDEIPAAYKPIEEVIEKSSDLVEVVAFIRQVICVKG
ncbi:MAG TPA: RtcB family protein [Thermoanaerobaculia bacterium]|jgi:tRNA-splicing ligase RtcB|nr:RtcB family protein [Thermoanaerobaculia bacterium]